MTDESGKYDPALASAAKAIRTMCDADTTDPPLSAVSEVRYVNPVLKKLREDVHEFAHYIQAGTPINQYLTVDRVDSQVDAFVELYLSTELSKLTMKYEFRGNEHVTVTIYASAPTRKAVETDQDIFTPQGVKMYRKEVEAAILEELRTWVHHKAFVRVRWFSLLALSPNENGFKTKTANGSALSA